MAEMADEIHHFLHSTHPLSRRHDLTTFRCDGCKTPGVGTRYRCDPCNFDLHIYCANCPMSVLSPLHPAHSLDLCRKTCNACRREVEGLFYRCDPCDFDLHPLCLQEAPATTPQGESRHHSLHPDHALLLVTRGEGGFVCDGCRMPGDGQRYRCEACNFDLHVYCATCPSAACSRLHQEHVLQLLDKKCDECSGDVRGLFYRCQPCNFVLHPLCHHNSMITDASQPAAIPPPLISTLALNAGSLAATKRVAYMDEQGKQLDFPETRWFFMHPEHDLVMVGLEGDEEEREDPQWCEVCAGPVAGFYYRCVAANANDRRCQFYAHPVCTLLQPTVKDRAHPSHLLHYLRTRVSPCVVCKENCIKWRYCCSPCNVHAHNQCLQGHGGGDHPNSDDSAAAANDGSSSCISNSGSAASADSQILTNGKGR